MHTIGIVGSGPVKDTVDLENYVQQVDLWIGVDRGALTLINNQIHVEYAIGDFDSVSENEQKVIERSTQFFYKHPVEKDQTDLELAINKAIQLKPKEIYLFGVTGGRLDHELINIQLLLPVIEQGIIGKIIDKQNVIEMTLPNTHKVYADETYPNISFIPFSQQVKKLTLDGFYYPIRDHNLAWGSTLCLSNKLLSNSGTFYYEEGILLLIKSRDC